MRMVAVVAGSLALAAGFVWTLQGAGWLKGSFMTGSAKWLVIGIVCMVSGAGLVAAGALRGRRT
jgi:hypothetical protein